MYDLSAGFDFLYRSFQGYLSEDRYHDNFMIILMMMMMIVMIILMMMMMMIVMSQGVCVGR